MFEIVPLAGNSYYIESPSRAGLVRLGDREVCLIDSGHGPDAGKKIRQQLDARGWQLTAIYNTHSNADHIGGNQYLQRQTGCKVYASGRECAFTQYPILEPSFLYGGFPPAALRHKFLLAQESEAELLTAEVLPEGMQALPLPGHFFDMTGFRTADAVVYLADCLASEQTLRKYRVCFLYDVAAYLQTLEMVQGLQAAWFVPAHAQATEDIAPLARLNADCVLQTAQDIAELCREPLMFDELLQKLFIKYELTMNFEQYALVGSTVRSYLGWLSDTGKVRAGFDNNRLLWERV